MTYACMHIEESCKYFVFENIFVITLYLTARYSTRKKTSFYLAYFVRINDYEFVLFTVPDV